MKRSRFVKGAAVSCMVTGVLCGCAPKVRCGSEVVRRDSVVRERLVAYPIRADSGVVRISVAGCDAGVIRGVSVAQGRDVRMDVDVDSVRGITVRARVEADTVWGVNREKVVMRDEERVEVVEKRRCRSVWIYVLPVVLCAVMILVGRLLRR